MKFLIAPDSFKGSCSSLEAANSIEKGILKVFPNSQTVKLSVADGGEGTVEAILQSCNGKLIYKTVTGPDNNPVEASYGILPNGTAIIEMASASGLPIVPIEKRNALTATTKGTGELIISAIDNGCTKIIIGLGGSATTDGGVGMAQALGYSFLDANGKELENGGGVLSDLVKISDKNIDSRITGVEFIAACDVNNPLFGKTGAAYIYAPQKAATTDMVKLLDSGLIHLDSVVKDTLGVNNSNTLGAGAAGGLGFGVLTFCKGILKSGITTVLDAIEFDKHLEGTDLVITGEGRIDGQSLNGKVPVGIAEKTKSKNIPLLVIAGGIGDKIDEAYKLGIDSVMSIVNCPMPLEEAMNNSKELLTDSAERAMRMIKIGMNL
ncbi:MAG: glycerate kinase [Spirochaetaceae bacterium]